MVSSGPHPTGVTRAGSEQRGAVMRKIIIVLYGRTETALAGEK